MQNLLPIVTIFVAMGIFLFSVEKTNAALPTTYTQENYWTTTHDKPLWFERDGKGGFVGETETGMLFTQTPILNTAGIRLHKFAIGTAFFYVSDKGIIQADSDLRAVSMYLAKV